MSYDKKTLAIGDTVRMRGDIAPHFMRDLIRDHGLVFGKKIAYQKQGLIAFAIERSGYPRWYNEAFLNYCLKYMASGSSKI